MGTKDGIEGILDILDEMEMFQGTRAGRELWCEKPAAVQNEDLQCFNKNLNKIREYIKRGRRE